MLDWLGQLLGWLMRWCYELTASYGIAILLFTVVTKIIMFPLSVMQQKNSIKMVKLQPDINLIKAQYINDSAKAGEETVALYKKEGYRPFLGLVPTLIQLPLIIGVINVVYQPLRHLLAVPSEILEQLKTCTSLFLAKEQLGLAWQIDAINLLSKPEFLSFSANQGLDTTYLTQVLSTFQAEFFGFNLLKVPNFSNELIVFPIIAILSTALLCFLQNQANVLQKEQRGFGRWGTTVIMIALAAYLSFAVPAGAVLYWTAGNLLAIGIMYLLNILINPKRYIDYEALADSRNKLLEAEKYRKTKKEIKAEAARSKSDYKRFFAPSNANKELVVYSVKNGFYRYYKDVLEGILKNSDIVIHYVTSDLHDEVFAMENERFHAYYIDGNDLIYFFMKLDADVVMMTMPEIEKYYYKRSLVRKDIDYVYIFHAMVSTHMQYRQGAFDYYDTIFCVGPHHVSEIRETEKLYNLPQKRLIEFGYPLLDDLRKRYQLSEKRNDGVFQILIAPSHQDGNILDSCIEEMLNALSGHGYRIIVRPHPQYMRHNPGRLRELAQIYRDNGDIVFETDFATNDSLYTSDLLVTDWSGTAMEYSFTTKRPCVFINTPMKVLNPEYTKISSVPINIQMRSKIGVSLDPENVADIIAVVEKVRSGNFLSEKEIETIVENTVYDLDGFGRAGVDYIIGKIETNRKERNLNRESLDS